MSKKLEKENEEIETEETEETETEEVETDGEETEGEETEEEVKEKTEETADNPLSDKRPCSIAVLDPPSSTTSPICACSCVNNACVQLSVFTERNRSCATATAPTST